jgi:hypothetical protein
VLRSGGDGVLQALLVQQARLGAQAEEVLVPLGLRLVAAFLVYDQYIKPIPG